jgi:flagellar motor switch protein FliG
VAQTLVEQRQNIRRLAALQAAAEIINLMKTQQEEAVIEAVRDFDGELAQKIIDGYRRRAPTCF